MNRKDDLISRQAAIEALISFFGLSIEEEYGSAIQEVLNGLPSAQPERKKGKWIPQDHNKTNGIVSTLVYYYPKCSVCGHCDNYTNLCPNCGAEMEGE